MGYQWSYQAEADRHRWLLKRNCSLRPWQLVASFVIVASFALVLATLCALGGAWMVVPFAIVEAIALTAAFVVHARHVGDYERIEASAKGLVVESGHGARVERIECDGAWVRVEYDANAHDPIWLVAGATKIAIGRFVPDDRKAALVGQLRGALAGC